MFDFKFNNKIIFILSPQEWGINMLSKHLYALELSKNNKVYFIHTVAKNQDKKVTIKQINSSLFIVTLKNKVKGISKLPSFLINFQSKRIISNILKELKISHPDVLWSFDQSRFQNLTQFNASVTIFHPVDYIAKAIPYTSKIANSADVVFSVSQAILDEIQTRTPKFFINHGLEDSFLKQDDKKIFLNSINPEKINVGYVGNLQMKLIDWKNMIKTVEENQQLHFIFIGPDSNSNIGGKKQFKELDHLKLLSNTSFTGALSKAELIAIMPSIDVFWLCYNNKKYPIEVSNSHKILEYLSTGKVVVSNYISTYDNNYLLETVENDMITEKIKDVCGKLYYYNSSELMTARIEFTKDNTYKKQIERIEKIIGLIK